MTQTTWRDRSVWHRKRGKARASRLPGSPGSRPASPLSRPADAAHLRCATNARCGLACGERAVMEVIQAAVARHAPARTGPTRAPARTGTPASRSIACQRERIHRTDGRDDRACTPCGQGSARSWLGLRCRRQRRPDAISHVMSAHGPQNGRLVASRGAIQLSTCPGSQMKCHLAGLRPRDGAGCCGSVAIMCDIGARPSVSVSEVQAHQQPCAGHPQGRSRTPCTRRWPGGRTG